MKINNLLKMFMGALMMTFIISSCADEFTEEDLLQAQYDLQQQQQAAADARENAENAREDSIASADRQAAIDALNQAGQLLDFSVTVFTDEAPVEGATITATNQAGVTASAATDASGNITLTDISMGGHTITMTSPDHVDLSFEIDFGVPQRGVHYEIIEGTVIPIETSESARITAIPLSGMLTSTVKGKVTIETDVTNNAPEIPTGVTLRANLTNSNALVSTSDLDNGSNGGAAGGISVTFTQANIGSAVVDDATGEYSMTLPAVPGLGLTYNFIMPTVEADATVAYSSTDNGQTTVDGGVAIGTFPAVFGPNAGGSQAVYTTNNYSNLRAVFSEPAAEGAGFSLDVLGTFDRDLPTETFAWPVQTKGSTGVNTDADAITVRVSRGAGYTSSPVVTIDGGGNTTEEDSATAKVGMEWKNTGAIAINNGGEGYTVGDQINIQIRRNDGDNNQTPLAGVAQASGEVTAVDGDGAITEIDFDDLPETGAFWLDWIDLQTAEVSNLRGYENSNENGGLDDDASFNLTYGGRVTDLVIDAGGEGYGSIPSVELEGGSPSTAATVEITTMGFQYRWAPNATVTTPYVLLPKTVTFLGTDIDGGFTESTTTGYTNGQLGVILNSSNTVQAHLEVKSDGTIGVDTDDFPTLAAGVTDNYYVDAPTVVVENEKHEQAYAPFDAFTADGEFVGFNELATGFVAGTGYTEPVTVTLENLDGTDADIEFTLTGFSTTPDTQEVKWNGSEVVTSSAQGFDGDINNNAALVVANNPTPTAPQNGDVTIVNFNYGVGGLLDVRVQ